MKITEIDVNDVKIIGDAVLLEIIKIGNADAGQLKTVRGKRDELCVGRIIAVGPASSFVAGECVLFEKYADRPCPVKRVNRGCDLGIVMPDDILAKVKVEVVA